MQCHYSVYRIKSRQKAVIRNSTYYSDVGNYDKYFYLFYTLYDPPICMYGT